jgi:hypothetical protein
LTENSGGLLTALKNAHKKIPKRDKIAAVDHMTGKNCVAIRVNIDHYQTLSARASFNFRIIYFYRICVF